MQDYHEKRTLNSPRGQFPVHHIQPQNEPVDVIEILKSFWRNKSIVVIVCFISILAGILYYRAKLQYVSSALISIQRPDNSALQAITADAGGSAMSKVMRWGKDPMIDKYKLVLNSGEFRESILTTLKRDENRPTLEKLLVLLKSDRDIAQIENKNAHLDAQQIDDLVIKGRIGADVRVDTSLSLEDVLIVSATDKDKDIAYRLATIASATVVSEIIRREGRELEEAYEHFSQKVKDTESQIKSINKTIMETERQATLLQEHSPRFVKETLAKLISSLHENKIKMDELSGIKARLRTQILKSADRIDISAETTGNAISLAEHLRYLDAILAQRHELTINGADKDSTRIRAIDSELTSLLSRLKGAQSARHGDVSEIEFESEELSKQIAQIKVIDEEERAAVLRGKSIRDLIENSKKRLSISTTYWEQNLLQSNRELELLYSQHRELTKHLFSIDIQKIATENRVSILEPASSQVTRLPGIRLLVGFILLFSFLLSLCLSVIIDKLNPRIFYNSDLEKVGLKVFASIPKVKIYPKLLLGGRWSPFRSIGKQNHIHVAFRNLRTRLHSYFGKQIDIKAGRIILVNSSIKGEGKTFVTSNLGRSFSDAGFKVAIVDCDLKAKTLTKNLKLENIPGVGDILLGKVQMSNCLYATENNHLWILPAGTQILPEVDRAFDNEMRDLLGQLRKSFDYVVIDSPPTIPLPDAALISRLVDVTLIVSSSAITHTRDALLTRNRVLENAEGAVFHILNRSTENIGKGSTYYYYASEQPMPRSDERAV